MEFDVTLKGIQELDKTFQNIPKTMQSYAYRRTLRAGAVPVRDAAEENIKAVSKKFTGIAQRRGTIRVYNLRKYRGTFRVAVQVRRGLLNPVKNENGEPVRVGLYLSVLEYGKKNQPPRSWIRKAIREKRNDAINAAATELAESMIVAIARARAK